MNDQKLKLAVILGSVREGRFGPVIARWFLERTRICPRFDVDLVDLAETPLPVVLPSSLEALGDIDGRPADRIRLAHRLREADAFVLVTPEYNHSFPAATKSLLDWHFTEWQGKPVGFVSYGGIGGGLRAVEQLRLVFAELHAVTVRDTVSFDQYWDRFDAQGQPTEPDGPNAAAATLLARLAWWGDALRNARRAQAYDGASA